MRIGDNVTFVCEINQSKPIRWDAFIGHDINKIKAIFNGNKVVDEFQSTSRFSVSTFNSTESIGNIISLLNVNSVQQEDAGFYACQQVGMQESHVVELSVISKLSFWLCCLDVIFYNSRNC